MAKSKNAKRGRPKKYTKKTGVTKKQVVKKNLSRTEKGTLVMRKTRKRASAEEMEERMDYVVKNILAGKPAGAVQEDLMDMYSISRGTARISMDKAKEFIKMDRDIRLDQLLHEQIARYEHLYNVFKNHLGREDLAIKAMDQKEKLLRIGKQSHIIQRELEESKGFDSNTFLDESRVSEEKKKRLKELLDKCMIPSKEPKKK
jgi:hypothetical protein